MSTATPVVDHLLACSDAVYRSLGENAPRLSNDRFVVRSHEMARAFGEVSLALRALSSGGVREPLAIIETVLNGAVAHDETGAMALYALAILVGPRLLVSLRDAREVVVADERVTAVLDQAATVIVHEIVRCGEVLGPAGDVEDERWLAAARHLRDVLERGGNADSFGLLA